MELKPLLKPLRRKTIGFGKTNSALNEEESIMQHIIPEDLLKFGLIPEFIGRLPVMAALDKLTNDDLVRILTEPKNALVKQYQKLLSLDDTKLEFEPEALKAIAAKAIERNTGARGLRSIIEEIMMDVMFDVPSDESIEKVIITKMAAEGTGKPTIIYNKKIKKLYKIEVEKIALSADLRKSCFVKLLNERLNRRTEENNERT